MPTDVISGICQVEGVVAVIEFARAIAGHGIQFARNEPCVRKGIGYGSIFDSIANILGDIGIPGRG